MTLLFRVLAVFLLKVALLLFLGAAAGFLLVLAFGALVSR